MVETAPRRETIAIAFDFDETLAPDSCSAFLKETGVDVDGFWSRVHDRIDDGWQPIPAQLFGMTLCSQAHPESRITREKLADFARRLPLYDGVEEMFVKLRRRAEDVLEGIAVEFYVISCGIAEIVRNTRIAEKFERIWANEFHYGDSGEIAFPRLLVSHTEKISYLYQIAAGIEEHHEVGNPFAVNQRIPDHEMRVPLDQMIYVGDGLTDMPCFSVLFRANGIALGVGGEGAKRKWGQAAEAAGRRAGRISNLAPPDFRDGSELMSSLLLAIESIGTRIAIRRKAYRD